MNIKHLFFTLIIQTITLTSFGQKPTCLSLHTGTFKIFSKESGTTLIKRTEKYQFEKNDDLGYEMIFDIFWIDDCVYDLRPIRVIKGDPSLMGNGKYVVRTMIKEITDYNYTAETSSNFSDEISNFIVEIIK